MTKIRIAKIAGIAAGATLAFGAFVPMAGAVTIAELQAQINALMAQLASLQGGSTTTTAACTFTGSLTVGSTGAQVTCLQQYLVANGKLVMPAGVAYGYFGSLTQAAVAAWQAANGVSPAVGYFGPISQAKFAAVAGTTVPGNTVGITTPGVEGTITVTEAPSPASGTKVYEGDVMKKVYGIEIEAKTSDMRVERIKLDLDETGDTASSDSAWYNKFVKKVYILDGDTVLASIDLNSGTVVEESNEISITLAGLSVVVPKNTKKVLTVAVDAMASWDSTYDNDTWTVGIPVDGVRSIDGAGVNQYGPSGAVSNSVTSAADLVENATLTVSTASDTPDTTDVVCTSGADEDECDALTVLKFNTKAEKDNVTITDLNVDVNMGGADGSDATTAYLYDGSTLVSSAAIDDALDGTNDAVFSDIDWVVSAGSTKTFTVKIDVADTDATRDTFTADVDTADVTAENSRGDGVTESGSASGNTIGVRKVGAEVSLVSRSVTTSGVAQSDTSTNLSTSTLTATFNIKIKAVGGGLRLGTVASGTPTFASSTTSFKVYRNGSYDGTISAGATSTSYSIPNECVSSGTNSCELAENAEVTVPVTFQIIGRTVAGVSLTRGSVYAIGMEGIQWIATDVSTSAQTTTFMAGDTDWRTSDVSFP